MSSFRSEPTPEVFNGRSAGHLPGLVGLQILTMTPQDATGFTTIEPKDVVVAEVDRGGVFVLESSPMTRWFFGYFFYFPRHLAEGNG